MQGPAGRPATMAPMATPNKRGRGRPRGGRPLTDAAAILDAAERVIARDGNGASIDAIAAEAGVTKPIVYVRVGSRAALSNALAERLASRLIVAAGGKITGTRPDRAALAAFIRATLETLAEQRELLLFVTRGAGDDAPERTLYVAGMSARPLASLLAQWHGPDADTEAALVWAYAIVGMLNMVSLWWIEESDIASADLADHLAGLLWKGIPGS